jgi:hypothetical protein
LITKLARPAILRQQSGNDARNILIVLRAFQGNGGFLASCTRLLAWNNVTSVAVEWQSKSFRPLSSRMATPAPPSNAQTVQVKTRSEDFNLTKMTGAAHRKTT